MKVEVLGPGCPECKKLFENAEKVVEELGISQIEVNKIEDLNKMMKLEMWAPLTLQLI